MLIEDMRTTVTEESRRKAVIEAVGYLKKDIRMIAKLIVFSDSECCARFQSLLFTYPYSGGSINNYNTKR